MNNVHRDYDGLQTLLEGLESAGKTGAKLGSKVEKTLQISIGTVLYRSPDLLSYEIEIDKVPYKATLAFNPKMYVMIGYPKLGEFVIVCHNNGNNAHILYSCNPKDKNNPPLGFDGSKKKGLPSSAKCNS